MPWSQLLPLTFQTSYKQLALLILPNTNINFIRSYFEECIFSLFGNICLFLLVIILKTQTGQVQRKNSNSTFFLPRTPLFLSSVVSPDLVNLSIMNSLFISDPVAPPINFSNSTCHIVLQLLFMCVSPLECKLLMERDHVSHLHIHGS